jgi:prepilin-type processing-associated H-X9-DG protein
MRPSASVSLVAAPPTAQQSTADAYHRACLQNSPMNPSVPLSSMSLLGRLWYTGHGFGGRYNHVMTPNSWCCNNGGDNANVAAYPPSSRHPGVVNVCFGDGTVRSITENIDINIWWALGSRNRQENIGNAEY